MKGTQMVMNLKTHLRTTLLAGVLSATPYAIHQAVAQETKPISDYVIEKYGQPPAVPNGELSKELSEAVEKAFVISLENDRFASEEAMALQLIAKSKDPRLTWFVADLLRFARSAQLNAWLSEAASIMLGKNINPGNSWGDVTDHLIAWNIPQPPDYLRVKRAIFTNIIPGWENIFVEGKIDWRHVSWGGVLIDDRAYDTTDELCNCIPAADNPEVSSAEDATWLEDDDIVFGIGINGEYRAYPRQIMEVREMVNDTLGGRDLGIPYCTLCGAAQAYFTDNLEGGIERPILRTSGLLIRSNKVMYDITSQSVFDTFLGTAVTGPLAKKNVKLKQAAVVTTDWATWKKAHPQTTVLLEKYALGRDPDFRNGRDANGPIFPVGDVDPRLPVHEDIIGMISASGTPIAFQRSKAFLALQKGEKISIENVHLALDAGGIKAVDENGKDLGSHQAFWFAWSQFHPTTILWNG
ncbi:MAG: DUF3179 domain-containing (seleno)protein [Nitratireductor sp.]